ncbi:MAG: universal stress protein [Haloarculaceae archaeon]
MYDRIMLPTDGSAGMERVVEHAAELAEVHDSTIVAIYVIDTTSLTGLPMDASRENIAGLLREEGTTTLNDVQRMVGERAPVERVLIEGTPSEEIVDHAREEDCDVIVMGTHGRGGLNRLLLGSVAERVVRTSTIPVLTVHVGEVDTGQEAGIAHAE